MTISQNYLTAPINGNYYQNLPSMGSSYIANPALSQGVVPDDFNGKTIVQAQDSNSGSLLGTIVKTGLVVASAVGLLKFGGAMQKYKAAQPKGTESGFFKTVWEVAKNGACNLYKRAKLALFCPENVKKASKSLTRNAGKAPKPKLKGTRISMNDEQKRQYRDSLRGRLRRNTASAAPQPAAPATPQTPAGTAQPGANPTGTAQPNPQPAANSAGTP